MLRKSNWDASLHGRQPATSNRQAELSGERCHRVLVITTLLLGIPILSFASAGKALPRGLGVQFATEQTALSREDARRQISAALSDDKYLLKKELFTSAQFKTNIEAAVDNQDGYHRAITTYLTADDAALSTWTRQNPGNPLIPQDFSLTLLRESWKLGLIDHFDISSKIIYPDQSNWPALLRSKNPQTCFYPNMAIPNNYDGSRGGTFVCKLQVDVDGNLKDSVRNFCIPQQRMSGEDRQRYCDIITARREVDQITGITSVFDHGQEIKVVEFDERTEPTAAGQFFALRPEVHPARGLFLLYDDGWRIVNIFD